MTGASPLDPAPILPGYTLTWDDRTGRWVATSDRFGTVLHGANQHELDEARWDHLIHLTDELQQIFRKPPAQPSGHSHSPPPNAP